jgi:tetratricopeptide (TPR) repeat protein
VDEAEQLHQRAVETSRAHDFGGALALVARGRNLTHDPDLRDRMDLTAAYCLAEMGQLNDAIRRCNKVLTRPGATKLTVGLAGSQLAQMYMRNGEITLSAEHFSLSIDQLTGAPEHLGVAHLGRGNLFLQQGSAVRAAEDFEVAAKQFELAGDSIERAKAIHNVGYARLLQGDLVTAIRTLDEVRPALAAHSEVLRGVTEQDRAEVLLAAGRPGEAVEALQAAISAYGDAKLRRYQAECEYVLSKTLMAEEPDQARTYARSAARRFTAHGSEAWSMRARSLALIAEITAGTRGLGRLTEADQLIAGLRAHGFRQEAQVLSLHAVRIAVRRRDLVGAASRISRLRLTLDSPVTTRLLSREVRSELAAARSQSARARSQAKQGLDELHSWQSTFGSLDLQTSAVGHGQHLARLGLRAAMGDGSPAVVFEWSERARALASRVTALRPPPDPELAAKLTALRLADPTDLTTRRILREQIRSHSWYAAQGTIGEPSDLAALQTRLAIDDSALVAHIVLDGTVTALTVTADDAAVVRIGLAEPIRTLLDRVAADLDFAARSRDGEIADAVRISLRTDLAKLADILVRPILSRVGYRRLVLTPSALLTGCPWTELPGLIGRPLTAPRSASQWLKDAAHPITTVREIGLLAGPRLQRAEEEIARAGESWPRAQTLSGTEADSARAGWLAARVDLLHIAGHGSHPGDHPLFSAIELADGPWFGHDIDLLPRVPEVVVLSACDLGRSSVLHDEESLGMSAVWLHAGARTVVSALALVADDLACEVFASWHRLVAGGTAPADALAQVSAETDDIVPFVCFGAGW